MFILRLLAVLTIAAVLGGMLAFLFTRNRKYLRFSWQVFVVAVVVGLLTMALLALERFAVIGL